MYSTKDVSFIKSLYLKGDILLLSIDISAFHDDLELFYSNECVKVDLEDADLIYLTSVIKFSLNDFYSKEYGLDTTKSFYILPVNSKKAILHCQVGNGCTSNYRSGLFEKSDFYHRILPIFNKYKLKSFYMPFIFKLDIIHFKYNCSTHLTNARLEALDVI